MSHALTLQTRLRWTEGEGCTLEGVEGTTLPIGFRRAGEKREGHGDAEAMLLEAAELATFRSFLSYAHSRRVTVRKYMSRAEASIALSGGGQPRITQLAIFPEVEVGTAEDVEKALHIFAELRDSCAVVHALGAVLRIAANVSAGPALGSLDQRVRRPAAV
jgi:hypothetical protein